MARQLIVNADDLGMSPGTNRGIIEARQRGIVTSATAMVNLPDAADGIKLAQAEAPQMGLGLHLNFTHGQPLTSLKSLAQADGALPTLETLVQRIAQADADEMADEVQAQFDRFVELAGGLPDHIDSHHHMAFMFPGALRRVLELAQEHNLPLRYPNAFVDSGRIRHYVGGALPREQAAQQADVLKAVYEVFPAPAAPGYVELSFRGQLTDDELDALLGNLPDSVSEIVCHPGYRHERNDSFNEGREAEITRLTDATTHNLIAKHGIELVTFAVL
jgi:predicted glycoside hydrolase/deacetylase ChbG (UPF0249 family)